MENGDKQETKTTSRVSGKFFARGEEQNGVTASFDTLASYLSTSTTFAKAVKCACWCCERRRGEKAKGTESACVFGLGTAKAKVLFAVDGLEVTVRGKRVDGAVEETVGEDDEGAENQEEVEGEESEREVEESEEEDAESKEEEEEEEESEEEQVEEANAGEGGAGEIYDEATPPPSSPSLLKRSLKSFDLDLQACAWQDCLGWTGALRYFTRTAIRHWFQTVAFRMFWDQRRGEREASLPFRIDKPSTSHHFMRYEWGGRSREGSDTVYAKEMEYEGRKDTS